ncbi:hypothetical protein HDU96_005283 [Phlyctochytrium bullatum]|nr:hypothetical protein HDU96_005283 [Phlyctochytrium bullatum]
MATAPLNTLNRQISLFPKELDQAYSQLQSPKSYVFEHGEVKWLHPATLDELLSILRAHPDAKVVNGNTEVGIETRFKNSKYKVIVTPSDIMDLKRIDVSDKGITIGAAVTIARMQEKLEDLVKTLPAHKTRGLKAILENCKWFAGAQVRNVSAIAGNIVTASPISDLNPAYKQAKRKDDDIAIVNSGMRVNLERDQADQKSWIIRDACLAFGGMGMAEQSSAKLVGKVWDKSLVDQVAKTILDDLPLPATAPGGQIEYRKLLALSFFVKFYLDVSIELSNISGTSLDLSDREISGAKDIIRPHAKGSQEFEEAPEGNIVGRSYMHASALKQITGAAQYIDDIPKVYDECAVAIVGSKIAHGRIKVVDTSVALEIPGVLGFVGAKDVPGVTNSDDPHNPNFIGPIFKDEELFASEFVYFVGQPIGLIVAETQDVAEAAAKLVHVEYESLAPIFTIEEAINAKSFHKVERKIHTGIFLSPGNTGHVSELHYVEGTVRMAGQEHFYLETQASLVVPKKEDNEIEIFASTQHPTETQHMVAHVLGIPSNRVLVRVKRMGGGFGGKETRSVFLTCLLAVAAKKYSKPMRLMLSREEDMAITGTRHPFLGNYRVGFTSEGKIITLELDLYSNGGYSLDLSGPVLERAMTHSDNAYKIPNVRINGKICKTNLPTNTAFRGFGGPQGMMIAEQWMTHVAEYLKKPAHEIRARNFYQEGDVTHYDCPVENYHMSDLWSQLLESSEYIRRQQEVAEYNAANKYKKRGIIAVPTKFGLAFTARFYNQAGALVHVYTDGSVLIAHVIQIAAQAFSIPVEKILARLQPLKKGFPDASWEELIKKAYFERINLSANGFYKTPDLTYDWEKNSGRMFSYFTYGGACTEVEIDVLTGDHVVLRSDVVMDIGTPINPAIDIGQDHEGDLVTFGSEEELQEIMEMDVIAKNEPVLKIYVVTKASQAGPGSLASTFSDLQISNNRQSGGLVSSNNEALSDGIFFGAQALNQKALVETQGFPVYIYLKFYVT